MQSAWTAKDPLRFADGMSPYIYVGNIPTTEVDPSGTITIKPLKQFLSPDTSCGDRPCVRWMWSGRARRWPCLIRTKGRLVRGPAYVIQKVDFFCDVVKCNKACPTKKPTKPAVSFLEATRITSRTTTVQDLWQAPCQDGFCGFLRHEGEVKFFCEHPTRIDLRKKTALNRKWDRGKKTFGAGDCTVTGGKGFVYGPIGTKNPLPAWWKRKWPEQTLSPSAKRWGQTVFDCCPGEEDDGCAAKMAKKTNCTSDAFPRLKKNKFTRPKAGKKKKGIQSFCL